MGNIGKIKGNKKKTDVHCMMKRLEATGTLNGNKPKIDQQKPRQSGIHKRYVTQILATVLTYNTHTHIKLYKWLRILSQHYFCQVSVHNGNLISWQ